jgi:dTDP-4-amino-4,6-dideoxygalactose transaminase
MSSTKPLKDISFIDLNAQRLRMGSALDNAILNVVNHGGYIMGPEIAQLEKELASFANAKHCLACSNGTDALVLILMAKNIGPGDAVLVPSFTFAASAEAVALRGATPIFIDVEAQSFNLCTKSLEKGYAVAQRLGLTPRGVISVDLFGQPADYDVIESFCTAHDLWLMSDAAQSFGATYKGRAVGSIGMATTTSFFPAKPLGCYGDGGACFTDDTDLYNIMTSLRVHGKGIHKYDNARIGLNARLDTVQAAILLEKLKIFPDEIIARQKVADRYDAGLKDHVLTPSIRANCQSTWAQYTLRIEDGSRDKVAERLKEMDVPTTIYYPKPLHQQTAYRDFPRAEEALPVSELLAKHVLSLPMHPYLDNETQDYIIDCVIKAVKA